MMLECCVLRSMYGVRRCEVLSLTGKSVDATRIKYTPCITVKKTKTLTSIPTGELERRSTFRFREGL